MTKLRAALLVSVLAVLAAASGCGQQNTSGTNGTNGNKDTKDTKGTNGTQGGWPADRTFLSTSVTANNHKKTLAPRTRIELTFTGRDQLGASAGCNRLGGTARIDGGKLVVGAISMTEMGCDEARMAQDTWLSTFLSGKPTFSLTGDNLVLTGGGTEIKLTDRRVVQPDKPLAATKWVVDTIYSGQTASSVPAGSAEAFLTFTGAGLFSGSTGCATVDGTAQVTDDTITLSSTKGFDTACSASDDVRKAMAATLLHGSVSYTITSNTLTLTGPGGSGLGLHAK